jgi:hypothetical protein
MANEYQDSVQMPYEQFGAPMNLDLSLISYPYQTIGAGEQFVPKLDYVAEPVPQQPSRPSQQRKSDKARVRTKSLPTSSESNASAEGIAVFNDPGAMSQITLTPPLSVDIKAESPTIHPNQKGKGRNGTESTRKVSPKGGNRRASTQGVVVPIPHQGRNVALAEQALKRKRLDPDEPQDDSEERVLQAFLSPGGKPSPKKGKSKKDHHACDRCFRNKTKVIRCNNGMY